MLEVTIIAKTHPDIVALDSNKIVITKKSEVWDDSVIAIEASAAASELPENFKEALKERKKLTIRIFVDDEEEFVDAFGSFDLKMTDDQNIVITKDDFPTPATIGVRADKSSADLRRDFVRLLQMPDREVKIVMRVKEV